MRIPILLAQHSSNLKKIEIDTTLREINISYIDGYSERRQYSESEFKDSTIVFTYFPTRATLFEVSIDEQSIS